MVDMKLAEQVEQLPVHLLEEAFERFSRSSHQLQERYTTLLKESEALREQLRDKDTEIQRAEQLATLGKTAAAMAHEIRNPLGAMKLFASLLKEDLADRPDSCALVGNIENSIQSIDYVVSNILQFSRNHNPTFTPVNICSILSGQLEEIKQHEGVIVSTEISSVNPFLTGNDHGLRQVFRNLFLNACQAMRYKGLLEVRTEELSNGDLQVLIQDSGPGIPEDLLDTLFEPFVTSRNEGTGLGLAIVKQIVDQHGGAVQVTNGKRGAKFQVSLPRHSSSAEKG
jgi:two-component system sensor histidine kinase AtoS